MKYRGRESERDKYSLRGECQNVLKLIKILWFVVQWKHHWLGSEERKFGFHPMHEFFFYGLKQQTHICSCDFTDQIDFCEPNKFGYFVSCDRISGWGNEVPAGRYGGCE